MNHIVIRSRSDLSNQPTAKARNIGSMQAWNVRARQCGSAAKFGGAKVEVKFVYAVLGSQLLHGNH